MYFTYIITCLQRAELRIFGVFPLVILHLNGFLGRFNHKFIYFHLGNPLTPIEREIFLKQIWLFLRKKPEFEILTFIVSM